MVVFALTVFKEMVLVDVLMDLMEQIVIDVPMIFMDKLVKLVNVKMVVIVMMENREQVLVLVPLDLPELFALIVQQEGGVHHAHLVIVQIVEYAARVFPELVSVLV